MTSTWQPVVFLAEDGGAVGWHGPGWYFCDPADRYAADGRSAVTGPYPTEAMAKSEFEAYCEIMRA